MAKAVKKVLRKKRCDFITDIFRKSHNLFPITGLLILHNQCQDLCNKLLLPFRNDFKHTTFRF